MSALRLVLFPIALLVSSGCYSPTLPQGVPCSSEGECPEGQICAADDRCYDPDQVPDGGINADAVLSGLEVSVGALEPPFKPTIAFYTLNLGLGAQELIVTPTASPAGGVSITVEGTTVESGMPSGPLALNLGANGVAIVVTADSGAESTYFIEANRGARILQQAYVKASNAEASDKLGGANDDGGGGSIALSGDTLAVAAPGEDSGANDINGVETSNDASNSGAVYVFVRDGESWVQQAYIKAANSDAFDFFGASGTSGFGETPAVALSEDTLAVGAPLEDSSATGINGNDGFDDASGAGAVYVFVRNGTTWSQQAYVKASNTDSDDAFGGSVALSGDTLVVGAPAEDSSSTGINGNEGDNSAPIAGAAYVFVRSGTSWSQEAYIKASNTEEGDFFGSSVAIDGNTLAIAANREASSSTGVNGNQGDNGAPGAGAVYVFERAGGIWSQQAYVKASNTDSQDGFGASLALKGDTLAVGASGEDSGATGLSGNEDDESETDAGAVYVFTRSGATWVQRAYVKASNSGAGDRFGSSLALMDGGLAVGAPGERSSAVGIDGDEADDAADGAGAVYLFSGAGESWEQLAYIKASNTDAGDRFGAGVALSSDSLAVAAPLESSAATGVDGNQADNSASAAGAAYVFQ